MKASKVFFLSITQFHIDNYILQTQIKRCPLFVNATLCITLTWFFEVMFQNIIPEKGVSLIFWESEGRGNEQFWGPPSRPPLRPQSVNHCRIRTYKIFHRTISNIDVLQKTGAFDHLLVS